ncbi:MAG: sulfur oxidation c-type cytochrome SoxX [Aquificaceae bacterium]|nr:sulfur oxidation c-type cytochrome SoxX [Aquificaceae bacterium]MCX8060225.1 sulfur oxidation c-type cytochrome SoxX [Aquificaceae bacterium]MDW8096982.1 sulfur oxidation c-type cytochrome SoxX [Aquificaceae bacterium]
MKRIALTVSAILLLFATAEPKQKKAQPKKQEATSVQQEAMKVLMSGFSTDPRFTWKTQQDEAQRICSQYPSMEAMPAQAIQKVIQLSQADLRYPQWGIFWGDWREGKKIVENPRGGRFASYGFSDSPTDKGGNCYACHLIEKGMPGGTMGPNLYQYGKRWNITKENMNTQEALERVKAVYNIIYNSWSAFPCSSMPRFGHNGALSPEDVMNIVTYLLHPDSPVNK